MIRYHRTCKHCGAGYSTWDVARRYCAPLCTKAAEREAAAKRVRTLRKNLVTMGRTVMPYWTATTRKRVLVPPAEGQSMARRAAWRKPINIATARAEARARRAAEAPQPLRDGLADPWD